jgi:hypothetical protein
VVQVTAGEFEELFRAVSTWGRWGEDDERGALNRLGPEQVVTAARLVRDGTCVTLSMPLNTRAAPDNPEPAVHYMTSGADAFRAERLRFAKDFVGADYHYDGHTHIDALCHVEYDGSLYNGVDARAVTTEGAEADAIDVLENGLVGRGVLLDIPRLRGVPWLEPGDHVFRDELEAAELE